MKMRYRKGEFLTADTANRLIAATLANTPRDGLGTRVVRGASGGFSIDITQPKGKRRRTSEASTHPWKVTLKTEDEATTATIEEGKVYEELLSDSEIAPSLTEGTVAGGDIIILQHTESVGGGAGTVSTSITSTYEGVSTDGKTISIIIANIVSDGEEEEKLSVEQVARNNFSLTEFCKDGELVRYFLAL